jgi:hypothetical protein
MDDSKKPTRDRQIDVMVNARARAEGYVAAWIARPEFKAALHRHDSKQEDGGKPPRKIACAE